jgi:hypothetical protein
MLQNTMHKVRFLIKKNKYISFIRLLYLFLNGLKKFNKKRSTPQESYLAMRKLFVLTNGFFNDFFSLYLNVLYPKYKKNVMKGILGNLSETELNNIVSQIKKEGYYLSNCRLDDQIIENLIDFAQKTPASFLNLSSGQPDSHDQLIFDSDNPISPIYKFNTQQLLENQNIQKLVVDQSLLAVAQEYLNCSPVLDLITMWWSVPFKGKGLSEAAQEYHYDMDRIKFLKIFIYLTDVDTDTGPHCYVKNSHIRKPKPLLFDGRKTDSEIYLHYLPSDCKELCGKAGTIILADTRGFHKGKPLLTKHRLIFQMEFANSLFGQNYPKLLYTQLHKQILESFIKKYPRTYSQLFEEIKF